MTDRLTQKWPVGTLILIGLSLSIGWGIRGNFGHEYGAAFAGSLAAIAAALLSGREDWRERVAYFAFFGALGWGFGASVSYMQVLSYTESGHASSQLYGYFATFMIGFLWGGMGGAGTGFAAAAPREKLTSIFKPLLFVFGAWILLDTIENPLASLLLKGSGFDDTWSRHHNPFYWFDADYLPAFFALLGAGAYDLWERKGEKNRLLILAFIPAGALAGWLIQFALSSLGLDVPLAHCLTYLQGDPSYIDAATGKPAFEASNMLNNWPNWFGTYPNAIGWVVGIVAGITAYFIKFGKFRNGSSLFVYMGGGWLISFLVFPVLGSLIFTGIGGLRMTPPRSDDWAGITGVFIGSGIWLWRNDLKPVAVASLISGTIGGLGFSGIQWLKQLMMSFGNPRILEAKGILPGSEKFISVTETWSRWQAQNWHSFLEQGYGFVNGIAIAVAIGFLIKRIEIHPANESDTGKDGKWWTKAFAGVFVMLGLTYFNVFKNVDEWAGRLNPAVWKTSVTAADGTVRTTDALWDFPYIGRFPGFHFLHMTPSWWFNLTWLLLTAACIFIIVRNRKTPLTIIPKSSLAKGQIIYLIVLWIMVVANFERALTGWHPSRLLTEWIIFVNAIIVTVLVIILPEKKPEISFVSETDYRKLYRSLWVKSLAVTAGACLFFLVTNRMIYHYPEYNKLDLKHYHTRFGPEASWRSKPNLKNGEHR
jgi:hypothetical protein